MSQVSKTSKNRKDGKRGERNAVRDRAQELSASGMPYQMAMAVAQGRLSLNEALERMARRAEIERLMRKHDLTRALATQIALGHAELDSYLAKRRMDAHRAEYLNHSCLENAAESGEPLVLGVHGQRRVKGQIKEVTAYEVIVATEDGEDERLHKLELKYAYAPTAWKRVRKVLKKDSAVAKAERQPIKRPQDRYSCSDKRLFRYLDQKTPVEVCLLEGELLQGTIAWFGRFEFGLAIKGDETVTIFRHALHRMSHVSGK